MCINTYFTISSVSYSAMTISFNYAYQLNGAEPFIDGDGNQVIFTVHMMGPTQQYFKPFRMVGQKYDTPVVNGGTAYTSFSMGTVTPSQLGLDVFTNGVYYFEVRFVGKRAVFPVCVNYTVSGIVPPITPTPTPTATHTPTPTPSPTPPTPTPTPTSPPSGYTIYTADEYLCGHPGCSLLNYDVEVAIPSGITLTTGYYYPDELASGKVYKIKGQYGSGPGIIITLPGSLSCNYACSV